MGWEDRPYYRDRGGAAGSPLLWLFTGSVPLFTVFGIRVRMHAMLLVLIALVLLFGGGGFGDTVSGRAQGVAVLFVVILLHEFGHCFAARWTGGEADEILMTPLGGLALASPRRRWLPTLITVAGGPAVNVLICLACGLGIYLIHGIFPLGPWTLGSVYKATSVGWLRFSSYLFWFYAVSYALLLFNLIPVFPLDGGQALQAVLWRWLGFYRSMMIALNIGLVGSVLMAIFSVVGVGSVAGSWGLFIAINCFIECYQRRLMMRAEGPWAFQEEDSVDYGASIWGPGGAAAAETSTRRRRGGRKSSLLGGIAARRQRRQARQEAGEQERIDAILAKVSAHGMHSLTWAEKRLLRKATERQRKRDSQLTRGRGS